MNLRVPFKVFSTILLLISPVISWPSWLSLSFFQESSPKQTSQHGSNDATELSPNQKEIMKLISVPFEANTPEDKFLAEAAKLGMELSGLDICYQKVMLKLKATCTSLTEEQIGKLGVILLNCQSAVEGRPTFTCTDEMTLRQCTKEMDQATWNSAYHTISNRARAVCYQVRQQQFHIKTEIAVNNLMRSSEDQIDKMETLSESQQKMNNLTENTIEMMSAGHRDLMTQQERLKMSQFHIQNYVASNLRELTREKALIAMGQKELADMTESIRRKLDDASALMQKNEDDRLSNHKEILRDLELVHKKAQEVWAKIDNSTMHILKQNEETSRYYKNALINLKEINATVMYLLDLINITRLEIDQKFGWLFNLIGGAGDQLMAIRVSILHCGYFIMAALLASFLQAPTIIRLMLLFIIPMNLISALNQGMSLDFLTLSQLILLITASHYLFTFLYDAIKQRNNPSKNKLAIEYQQNSNKFQYDDLKMKNGPLNEDISLGEKLLSYFQKNKEHDDDDVSHLSDEDTLHEQLNNTTSSRISSISTNSKDNFKTLPRHSHAYSRNTYSRNLREPNSSFDDSGSVASSKYSTVSRRSNSSNLSQCHGYTKAGSRCKLSHSPGSIFCSRHGY